MEEPGQRGNFQPVVSDREITELLQTNYGIRQPQINQLLGYDDKNYLIKILSSSSVENPYIDTTYENGYVLKITNSEDSKDELFVQGQHQLMAHIGNNGIKVPLPIKNLQGNTYSIENFENSSGHMVRLLTYQPGKTLVNVQTTQELLKNVGKFVGNLSNCLKDFKHRAFETRKSKWMLESVLNIRQYLHVIDDEGQLNLVTAVLKEFESDVLPMLHVLERGTIHGDINEQNIVVKNENVEALLDFGDSHNSLVIFDLAICICYMLIHSNDINSGKHIISGYIEKRDLNIDEKKILKVSICARLCQSLVLGLHSYSQDPGNEYILATQKNGWTILQRLHKETNDELLTKWNLI